MLNEKDRQLPASESQQAYLKWRGAFVLKLALFHFALVLIFDLLAIYAPGIMSKAAWSGSAFTIGLVFALGIIFSIITATCYYTWRLNREEMDLKRMTN